MPLVSVISPQFLRLRDDKSVHPQDIRIEQVTEIVPVPQASTDASQLTLRKSDVLQREVYVKTIRGELLVRKFMVWKTNKEHDGQEFPAFVAYYADFSPSRKVPLTREVRVSNSKSQILALFRELKDENIKKGWERFDDQGASKELADIVSGHEMAIAMDKDSPRPVENVNGTISTSGNKRAGRRRKSTQVTPESPPSGKKRQRKKERDQEK
jgi:hypothetical protein